MPRPRPFLAGLAVAVVAMLATAASASAHDRLISSDPAAGQSLTEAPDTVSLTFSADVLDVGAAVVVSDDGGTDWVSAAPTVDGTTVTAVLDPGLPEAGYQVRWRVVSSDGHPITGVVPFVVGDGSTDGSTDGAADPGEVSTPGTDTQRGTTQGDTQTQGAQEDEGPLRVVLVGAGGAAVAVALFVLVQYFRRRSDGGGPDEAGNDPGSSDKA